MLLMYRLSDFERVPFVPVITGITFASTFHMRLCSVMGSLYFKIFSASYLITFLSPEIATFINMLYAFFWVIPRLLNFICQRFGTLCLFQNGTDRGFRNVGI
jgi:hypothetical protein